MLQRFSFLIAVAYLQGYIGKFCVSSTTLADQFDAWKYCFWGRSHFMTGLFISKIFYAGLKDS